jgi:carbamoylphosphate synthase large subunit
VAATLGYPVMLRPSYVLGGRAMEILYSDEEVERYVDNAVRVDPSRAVLVDKYLDRATEVDCDALCDIEGNVVIGGVMVSACPAFYTLLCLVYHLVHLPVYTTLYLEDHLVYCL